MRLQYELASEPLHISEPRTLTQERARILGKTATPRAPGEEGAEGKDDKSGPSGYTPCTLIPSHPYHFT